jgi:dTMP kinase
MASPGRFIVIEGTDGSGKATHTKMLVEWLETNNNHDVVTFDFPQYGKPSAYFVEQYLNGHYGELSEIGPYRGSLFYALDRYEAGFKIRQALSQGSTVVSNRYVGSNMGHQGGKIRDLGERQRYYDWNDQLEFEILGIPQPDLNIVLLMPSEQAQQFVDQKTAREYTKGKKRDLHEADINHLKKAEQTYREICRKFPNTFTPIECFDGRAVLSLAQVQSEIRQLVTSLLKTQRPV